MKKEKILPFHPFLLAIYFVIGHLAINLGQFEIEVLNSLAIALIVVVFLYLAIYYFVKEPDYTGYLTTLSIFLFFFYGDFYNLIAPILPATNGISPNFAALIFWAFLLGAAGSRRAWKLIESKKITKLLNISTLIVLIFPVYQLVSSASFSAKDPLNEWTNNSILEISNDDFQVGSLPDIYYIILDGYAGADVLSEFYSFDNSELVMYLENQGFYVAEKSRANYLQTALSLSSTLNLRYLDDLNELGSKSSNRDPLFTLIQHSGLRSFLENQGYKTLAFSTGYSVTELEDADYYYERFPDERKATDFEAFLLNTSLLGFLYERIGFDFYLPSYDTHRDLIQHTFDLLPNTTLIQGPKFVFAHIISPHPPFVFDAQGQEKNPKWLFTKNDANDFPGDREEYIDGYINQIQFINQRLMNAIRLILLNSETPPIIIIQGDHGPGSMLNWASANESCLIERASILNAIYMPERAIDSLYENISPVNSFRLILHEYFDKPLEFLEDKSYYSTWGQPYNFQDISNFNQESCQ